MSEERETTSANDGTSSAGKGRVDLVGKNPRPRDRLIHSVSIIVEAVHDDGDDPLPVLEEGVDEEKESNDSCCRARQLSPDTELQDEEKGKLSRKQRHQSSPIIFLDDPLTDPESQGKLSPDEQAVQSIFATARLRKEAFARLLEEHAQLVEKINRAETSLI